jgi:hypothetical protein
LGVTVASLAGNKKPKLENYDAVEWSTQRAIARQIFNPSAARILMELQQEGKVPSWVQSEIDFNQVAMAAD